MRHLKPARLGLSVNGSGFWHSPPEGQVVVQAYFDSFLLEYIVVDDLWSDDRFVHKSVRLILRCDMARL